MKITQKTQTQILSILLCLFMVAGSIFELPMTISAAEPENESVSANTAQPDSENNAESADDSAPQPFPEINTAEEPESNGNTADAGTSDGEEPDIGEAGTAAEEPEEPKTITVTFYDSDGVTVLLSVPMTLQEGGCYLSSYLDSAAMMTPVKNGYKLSRWCNVSSGNTYTVNRLYSSYAFKKDQQYKAQWSTSPYTFNISYELNSGKIVPAEGSSYPKKFTVETETLTLPDAQRKGYIFDGWYTDNGFTNKVKTIPKGTYIDSDDSGQVGPYTLYAKWTSAKPAQMKKPTAQNSASGKIKVSIKKVSGAEGYEIVYAANKNFTKSKMTKTLSKNQSSFTLTNLPKNKTYYFKVRAYRTDSTGKICYGKYSQVRSCKVKKGVKEYTAKSNSGKLKKVSVKGGTDLYVTASVSKRLKSSDEFYYLVKVDPNNGKVLKQIAKSYKTKTVTFRLPLKDEKGNNHIQGKFGVAVKKGKKYMLITSTSFINNPQAAATYTAAFPKPASKKGRQGIYSTELGDKNFFNNFYLDEIIGTKSNHDVAYKYNGKTYYFNYPNFGPVSFINSDGGTVTIQVMLRWNENSKDLILKSGRKPGAHYYAFNTEQKAAREKLEAAFCFLAEQGSRDGYHVDNWILGNEVNTYANPTAKWYYAGNISRDKFMENYASTYRMLYYAVKSNNKNGRVYICTDHTWIDREQDWGTKNFTVAFNKEIKSQNKNIKWNLAYHAYSAVLTNADFWNDGSLAPNSENADFVSPKNLEILTSYVKKNFGNDVRIILSEQGFSCSGGVGSPYNNGRQTGEDVQAAAVAWLYYKAQFNDMIDAVIFNGDDHGGAGFQFDVRGRKAENVYKYMDTPKYATYTKKCLKTIGASSWKSVVNGFSDKKLKKMPKR